MRINRRSLSAGLAVLLVASSGSCSTRGGETSTSNRNLVTHEELIATNARNTYEALERLRPSWMTSRGPANMGNVRDASESVANVYINGNRMGSLDYLKQVYVSDVHEIRFWNPGEAGARFGMGNPRGVIEIIPRR
jgi:hypothetical protein